MIFWFAALALVGLVLAFLLVRLKFKLVILLKGASFTNFAKYKSKLKLKLLLWVLIFGTLFIAILAPKWGDAKQQVSQAGRHIIIALDVSKSMLAQDLKPSRLDFAKDKIKQLVANLAGEHLGLILFAGDAMVMCPLTRDYDLLLSFLAEVDQHTISSGATNLAGAITQALKMFTPITGNETKLLAVFTDGEDFSPDLVQAGSLAQQAGVHIFTFGVATVQGAPIPDFDLAGQVAGFVKDQHGNVVISRLNHGLLQEVAQQTAGQSTMVQVNNNQDLQQMYKWVAKFERTKLSQQEVVVKPEKYYYFATIALLGLLIEWIL